MITLEKISQKVSFDIQIVRRGAEPANYAYVQLITPLTRFSQSNTLYLGRYEMNPEFDGAANDIGLLLIGGKLQEIYTQDVEMGFLDESCDIQECYQALQTVFRDQTAVELFVRELYQSLSRNEGLQKLAELAKKHLENPVAISDSSYILLAHSGQEENDFVWNDIIKNGKSSNYLISKFHLGGLAETLMKAEGPVILDMGVAKKRHRIQSKIIIDGKLAAVCGVLESTRKIKNIDLELMQVLTDAITIELQKSQYAIKDNKNINSLLIDLLESRVYLEKSLNKRLKYLLWQPAKYFNVLVLKKNETINAQKYFVERSLENFSFFSKALEWEDNIVTLINYKEEDFSRILSEITILLKDMMKECAGISKAFTTLLQFPIYYNQAVSAHYWGSALNNNNCLYRYEDYFLYNLLGNADKSVNIQGMCDERLLRLKEYDKKNRTEYFNTLYVFLYSMSNISTAAKKLYIHRNTMTQRIKRICEIADINLSSNQDIFNMMLTYKILELIG